MKFKTGDRISRNDLVSDDNDGVRRAIYSVTEAAFGYSLTRIDVIPNYTYGPFPTNQIDKLYHVCQDGLDRILEKL